MTGVPTVGQLEVHSIHHRFVAVASDICAPQKRREGKADLERRRGISLSCILEGSILGCRCAVHT